MTANDIAVIRALCIAAYAEHNPEWANLYPHDHRLKWARDIVRQVAEQPMPWIDERIGDE